MNLKLVTRKYIMMKCKFISCIEHVQMKPDNPQDGHWCGVCHNTFDAKVNIRKFSYYKSNVMK